MGVEWKQDLAGALMNACTKLRPAGSPPHWTRCLFMAGRVRCKLFEGHPDKHLAPEGEEPASTNEENP